MSLAPHPHYAEHGNTDFTTPTRVFPICGCFFNHQQTAWKRPEVLLPCLAGTQRWLMSQKVKSSHFAGKDAGRGDLEGRRRTVGKEWWNK